MIESTPRPGGWREERSPDGRITMYVSPKGERLSREEFFDQYPQGTGGSQSIVAGMMKDVASGRSQASIPDKENLKVGVILQPRGKLSDFADGRRPSSKFFEADQQLKTERVRTGIYDRVLDGRPQPDHPTTNKSMLRNLAEERAQAFREYKEKELGLPPIGKRPTSKAPPGHIWSMKESIDDLVGKEDVLRRERDLRAMYESREPAYRREMKGEGDLYEANMRSEIEASRRGKESWLPEDRAARKMDPSGQVLPMKKR